MTRPLGIHQLTLALGRMMKAYLAFGRAYTCCLDEHFRFCTVTTRRAAYVKTA